MATHPAQFLLGKDPSNALHVLRPGELLLGFREGTGDDLIAATLGAFRLTEHEPPDGTRMRGVLRGFSMRWVDVLVPSDARDTARALLAATPELYMASPVYDPAAETSGANAVAPIPGVLVARTSPDIDAVTLARLDTLGVAFDEEWSRLFTSLCRFIVQGRRADDGFALVGRLQALLRTEAVTMDWVRLDPLESPLAPRAGITLWSKQWNLKQTSFPQAWALSPGTSATRIGVVDTGFDLKHPAFVGAFTAKTTHRYYGTGSTQSGDVTIDPTPAQDPQDGRWHGTAVAGLIASRKGVRGAAGLCRVLPIRVNPCSGSNVAGGLLWAAGHKVRVANLSLSLSPYPFELDPVEDALAEPSVPKMLICAAAGNVLPSYPVVKSPGSFEQVLCVGATIKGGARKVVTGAPNEEVWMSPIGLALDVVAPGLLVPTVDAAGTAGYNEGGTGRTHGWYGSTYTAAETGDAAGNYLFCFTGTSAAVAHVSALAGLLFAKKPALVAAQVRAAIEGNCDHVAGDQYANTPGHPNGTWSPMSGYGRINARAAVASI